MGKMNEKQRRLLERNPAVGRFVKRVRMLMAMGLSEDEITQKLLVDLGIDTSVSTLAVEAAKKHTPPVMVLDIVGCYEKEKGKGHS